MGRIKITDNEQTITNDVFIDLAYQEEISVAKHILQIDPDYIKLLGFIPTRIRKQINSDIDVRLEDATCIEGISIENGQQCLYIKHNGAIHKGTSTHNIKGTTDMEVVMLSKEMNLNADEWREALVKQKRYQVGYRWVVEGQKNKKEKYGCTKTISSMSPSETTTRNRKWRYNSTRNLRMGTTTVLR